MVSHGGLVAGRISLSPEERGLGKVPVVHILVHDNGGGLVGHCCGFVAAARSSCSCFCAASVASDAQGRGVVVWRPGRQWSVEVQDYVSVSSPNVGPTLTAVRQEMEGGCPANYGGRDYCLGKSTWSAPDLAGAARHLNTCPSSTYSQLCDRNSHGHPAMATTWSNGRATGSKN
jgi:hypothetical protein